MLCSYYLGQNNLQNYLEILNLTIYITYYIIITSHTGKPQAPILYLYTNFVHYTDFRFKYQYICYTFLVE